MYNYNRRLQSLEKSGKQIRVGIIGSGQMGRTLVSQIKILKGMKTVILISKHSENAKNALIEAGFKENEIAYARSAYDADRLIEQKFTVYGDDNIIACSSQYIDAVVDATGSIEAGAEIAFNAIQNKKHIIMLNAECDATVGPILKSLADDAGVIYTGTAGDEPGSVMELYDYAQAAGFEILAMGKGKNNKVNFECTPDDVLDDVAMTKGTSAHMLTSFREGTKTMVELALMCNATGFLPDKRGCHGIKSDIKTLTEKLRLKSEGGILDSYKTVEYVDGIAPGVFIIVTSPLKLVHDALQYLKMGDGPNYVLYRPFHLISLETPISIAMAVLDNEATIAPISGLVAEVITVAKRDLKAGEFMDGYGAYTCYGTIEKYEIAKQMNAVPIGFINSKTKVLKNIKKGDIITYDMVEIDKNTTLYNLRKLQDKIYG